MIFLAQLQPQVASAAPVFAGATRLFEIEQEGRFKRSAPAVERLKTAADFYDFYSASSHTGFEVARRSLIFLYRDIRNDDLAIFLTHGIDNLGQPAAQQQPSATVEADITGVPQGARIAEQDDNGSEFNWGANLNQTRGNLTGNGPPIALGRWSFGSNTDGGAIDRLPTDQNWEITVSVRFSGAMDEWAYFFADGTLLTLDPNLPIKIRSRGGEQEADQVASSEGQSVTFCALATDNAANQLTYTFNWQDGSDSSSVTRAQGTLACLDHAFPDNGNYNVQVIARNPQGQSTSKIITAIISNEPPSLIPGGPFVVETQVPVTLEVNEIQDPGSADTHQMRWDFDGDGTWDTPFRNGVTAQAIYDRPGRYFARAEVRDDEGATGQTTMTVYAGVPPAIYAEESDPNIIIAGYSPTDPGVPFPVHRGAPITLKAILRNTVGCNSYQVIWDVDEDGEFETNGQDKVLNVSPSNGSVHDVGVSYLVPDDAVEGRHLISIRAKNNCNGFIDYDVMRLYVYPWKPGSNPTQWTKEELDVMVQIGVQEGLWYMHRKMGGRSGAGSQILGYLNASGARISQATAMAIWAFTINGRLPAYPPDSINTYNQPLPEGWSEENLIRWRLDPYAETVTRMVNYVMSSGGGRPGVNGSDEDNACDLNGTQCPRLASSQAGKGAYVNGGSNYTYSHGVNTGALATVLPALAHTPIQTGNLAGQLWEGFVQDQVDYLGYLQIPSGCGKGGWYYNRTTSTSCIYMDASTAQWGYIGLESAEVAGFRYGVFVNNNHKYKTGWNIVRNQDRHGSSSYRTDYGWSSNNLTLTGGFFVIARWLGFQDFRNGDNARPFPHSDYTKGQMRRALDRARSYTANKWTGSESGDYHINRRFWRNGSYLCGNSNRTYKWGREATCGNLYGMYSHQKGYRTTSKQYDRVNGEIQEGEPEPAIGGHDWAREFSIYTLRSQERNVGDYGNFGRIDDCYGGGTIACDYGSYNLGITMGTLILTPTVFKPRPVADGEVSPPEVLQGCASPDAGWVTLSHQTSFHPNPKSRIDRYEWDMDASDGYWWDGEGARDNISTPRIYFDANGQPLDGAKRKLRYNYQKAGTYTVTLRVVDGDGEFNTKSFTVRVLPMQPSDPTASARAGGGRYIADANLTGLPNGELAIRGTADDLNLQCDDSPLTIRWSVDGGGRPVPQSLRNRVEGWRSANGKLTANDLRDVTLGHTYRLTINVTDATNRSASDTTDLVIYPTHPVASWRANPVSARCGQSVSFDAQQSYHPFSAQLTQAGANDPSRDITVYKWDLDNAPGYELSGADKVVDQTYNRFGVYTARLQVCDDANYCTDANPITIDVNQGNQAPVAKLPVAELIHLTEDPLTLNAGASFDNDVNCGDRIVSYRWYFNPVNDTAAPQFTEADPELTLDWAALQQVLVGPADPRTGEPYNTVILEVEDTLGLKHRTAVKITLYPREPVAHFDQLPSPAPINEETGEVRVELNARESFSPRPGGRVINYAWDVNDDGQFDEFIGSPEVEVRKIFQPIPSPNDIPAPIVRLKVTDDRGEVGFYEARLTYGVGDVPPTADADPSDAPETGYHILEGDSLFLSGAQSIEPNREDWVRIYRWWVNREPNAEWDNWQLESIDDNGDKQEAVIEVTPAQLANFGVAGVGEYTIHFRAEDRTFLSATDTSRLTVHAPNPIARVSVPRSQVGCGEQFTLDGSASEHPHPQIDITSYEWDLDGDGQYGTAGDREGAQVLFTANQFSFDGPQVIKLRVTDSRGNVSEAEVSVSVDQGNSPPVADVGGPYAVAQADSIVRLDASASRDGEARCGDAIVSYEWDLDGDNAYGSSALERRFSGQSEAELNRDDFTSLLNPNPLGVYNIGIRVVDRWGASQESRGELQVFRGPQAVAVADPPRAACDTDVTFSGLASTTDGPVDQGFRITSYAWDFDQDGEVDSTDPITIYRVGLGGADVEATLTVTDESGRTSSDTVLFEINLDNNVSPVANVGGPYATGPINAGQMVPIDLDARASYDPDEPCDNITVYKWDTDGDGLYGADDRNGAGFLNGSDYTGAVVRGFTDPTWEVGLSKLVRVIVCDGRGACSAPSVQEVDVRPNAPPTGEIISPRADECLTAADTLEMRLKYRDPDGGSARVKVLIDDIEVHRENLEAAPDGSDREATLNVDVSNLPDGLHDVKVEIGDFQGAATILNTGGIMTFDREAPTIEFGRDLINGACYAPGQAPDPAPQVSDDLDTTPSMEVRFEEEACLRTVNVTATDSCGNRAVASKSYRVSGPVELQLDGPANGELVGGNSARFSWTVDGPQACVNAVTAEINSEGGRTWVYQEGDQIEDPGAATLTLNVRDCANQSYTQQRSFRVNAPPVSRPQPPGHPNSVALAAIPTYQVDEGQPLLLEGSSSTSPEEDDAIAHYRWDLNSDGDADVEGEAVNADTSEDGSFPGILEVEDGFGATHTQRFEVIVNDVDPIADIGGPYQGLQGREITFDASNSRAANDADLLSNDPQRPGLVWDWGDGSTTEGAYNDVVRATHVYADDGLYQVRLRVRDEDSESTDSGRVSVGDVSPVINSVELPDAAYALQELKFEVDATPGAPNDPIIAYEWDFLGQGDFEEFPNAIADYYYLEAGEYRVTLRVADPDSATERSFDLTVREVTLSDILREIDQLIAQALADPQVSAGVRSALAPQGMPPASEWVERGLWSEQRRLDSIAGAIDPDTLELNGSIEGAASLEARMSELYRGNTVLAFDELLFRLNRAQVNGARFGALMWKVSRQLLRETEASYQRAFDRAVIAFDEGSSPFLPDDDVRLASASERLALAREMFEGIDYFDRVTTRDGFLARDLHAIILESHFLLRDVSDISHQSNEFELSGRGDPVARVAEGNTVNQDLIRAINQLTAELSAYVAAAGDDADPGPGLQEIQSALTSLEQIQGWVVQPIGLRCLQADPDHPDCQFIDDEDSLSLQLALMDLVGDLFAAADAGVYVRNAQQLLTVAVKFRVEVALLRVEELCGLNNPYPLSARAQQRVLLNLLGDGQRDAALLYYIAPERRCLVYEQYNECVLPALNQLNPPDEPDREAVPYPAICEGVDQLGGGGQGEGDLIALELSMPPRDPFIDLNKLFDIIRAVENEWNVADEQIRNQRFPGRTWADFNRDSSNEAFDLNDLMIAIMQFNHDTVDYDGDGMMGLYEIDCRVRFGMPMSPMRAESMDGPDGDHDCDGDGIPNRDEIAAFMNPVEPADAAMDTDGDGLSNYHEWSWAQRGLEVDMRDPSDADMDQDGDGVANGLEIMGGLDPMNPNDAAGDFDQDGLSNGQELNNGLNPRDATDADADQDGDGLSAREEINRGRNPLVADCEADDAEIIGRNDEPERAHALAPAQEGLICSTQGAEDVDWYSFEVTRDNQRFAIRLLTDEPGLTMALYQAADGAQVEASSGGYEDGLIALPRGQLDPGEYWVKVSHRDGDRAPQTPYSLEYVLINPDLPCLPDAWEGDNGNNQRALATVLGLEELRFGNAWVCEDERNVGDWYAINLDGRDKTVHIGFSPNSDGQLELTVMDQDLTRYVESVALQKSAQCININANGQAGLLYVRVTASTVYADGDGRVDYTMQVLDTDLEANPRGECDTLNNGLFDFFAWPTLNY